MADGLIGRVAVASDANREKAVGGGIGEFHTHTRPPKKNQIKKRTKKKEGGGGKEIRERERERERLLLCGYIELPWKHDDRTVRDSGDRAERACVARERKRGGKMTFLAFATLFFYIYIFVVCSSECCNVVGLYLQLGLADIFPTTNNFWIKRLFISRAPSTLIDYHSSWYLMNFVDVVKVSKVHCFKNGPLGAVNVPRQTDIATIVRDGFIWIRNEDVGKWSSPAHSRTLQNRSIGMGGKKKESSMSRERERKRTTGGNNKLPRSLLRFLCCVSNSQSRTCRRAARGKNTHV